MVFSCDDFFLLVWNIWGDEPNKLKFIEPCVRVLELGGNPKVLEFNCCDNLLSSPLLEMCHTAVAKLHVVLINWDWNSKVLWVYNYFHSNVNFIYFLKFFISLTQSFQALIGKINDDIKSYEEWTFLSLFKVTWSNQTQVRM